MFRKLALICLAVYVFAQLWTAISIVTYSDPDPIPNAAAIVVLSGPYSQDPSVKGETRIRVDRGIELWKAGLAPVLVMSGGGSRAIEGPGDAHFMAEYAIANGVPRSVISTETGSFSTLQNAWFTADLPVVNQSDAILLVTQRYHLTRSVLSFRWAGFTDITPIAAERVPFYWTQALEGIKWPLNLARGAGASVALWLGAEDEAVLPWLQ